MSCSPNRRRAKQSVNLAALSGPGETPVLQGLKADQRLFPSSPALSQVCLSKFALALLRPRRMFLLAIRKNPPQWRHVTAFRKRGEEMKRNWSVAVVYEDTSAREGAVKFCDLLVHRFWAESEFSMDWRGFSELEDEAGCREAEAKCAEADLIVFATRPETELPDFVRHWMEGWVTRRGEREGALIGLNDPAAGSTSGAPGKFCYLRSVAHRAGMDYLTNVPEQLGAAPESTESCSERARQVTHVLDEILHRREVPRSVMI